LKLTPLDIKKQEFKRTFRGFDPVEVETFLEMVAEEYEALIREKNNLSDEVLKLRTQLRDYQEVEKTLKQTLMSAQQTIDQSKENSKKEADLIIREAEIRAEELLESTKIKLSEMKNELLLIKSQRVSFAKRLKQLLESQLELIGVLEIEDLGLGKLEKETRPPIKKEAIQFADVDEEEESIGSLQETEMIEHPNPKEKELQERDSEGEQEDPAIPKDKDTRISDQFIIQ
jgi:cell division initiation protein